jgi:hypothetical protein
MYSRVGRYLNQSCLSTDVIARMLEDFENGWKTANSKMWHSCCGVIDYDILKMKAECSSEKLLPTYYKFTRCHNRVDCNINMNLWVVTCFCWPRFKIFISAFAFLLFCCWHILFGVNHELSLACYVISFNGIVLQAELCGITWICGRG